jgi:Ribosomal protein S20.
VRADIESHDKHKALESFREASKVLDSAASRKVSHKSAAARTKSRLSEAIKAIN